MPATPKKKTRTRRIVLWSCFAAIIAGIFWAGPGVVAYASYEPREGDVIFQSLPLGSDLVSAIEGCTNSPWSHCGIVGREDGKWVVYEAIGKVRKTPLWLYCLRSRNFRFAVYRIKQPHREHIPATLASVRGMLGRDYDFRYRMDDEKIYCSELIWKAWQEVTGKGMGQTVLLGDLNWQPYRATIERYEGGPVPKDRVMITPRDLANAAELRYVTGCRVP